MNAKRLAEIEQHLADLGDITSWKGEIDQYGDLVLKVPHHFGWENDEIILSNMEISDAEDHALLEFLGDAPHAIRELIGDNRAAFDLLQEVLDSVDLLYHLQPDLQQRMRAILYPNEVTS